MKTKKLILILAAIIMAFTQCKKDDEENNNDDTNNTAPTDNSVTIRIDVHNDITTWRYFSFSSEQEVTVSDFSNDSGWDLGFHYENFRTNGGASGTGQGAVLDLGAVDFAGVNISSINGQNFTADDSIVVISSMAMPPVMDTVPGADLLEDMFESPQGPPPHTYTPNNHVYVIKTASGKHVKLLGTSFFNDEGTEGYLNLKYEKLD